MNLPEHPPKDCTQTNSCWLMVQYWTIMMHLGFDARTVKLYELDFLVRRVRMNDP